MSKRTISTVNAEKPWGDVKLDDFFNGGLLVPGSRKYWRALEAQERRAAKKAAKKGGKR
jgi:hypothetical protein